MARSMTLAPAGGRDGGGGLLIHLDRVDLPISLLICSWVAVDIVYAGRSQGRADRVVVPDLGSTSPVTAESVGENDGVVGKEFVNLAAGTAAGDESGRREAPGGRVRSAGGDVPRDGVAGEVPNGDVLRGPLHDIHSSTDSVEAITIVGCVAGLLTTAGVAAIGVTVALLEPGCWVGADVGDAAARKCVQGDCGGSLVVDTLKDINFAGAGPVGSKGPKSWPGAANAAGHMGKVADEEAMSESLVGG